MQQGPQRHALGIIEWRRKWFFDTALRSDPAPPLSMKGSRPSLNPDWPPAGGICAHHDSCLADNRF